MQQPRASGLLLHLSSLPGPYGIGDLGHEAYAFADFLARAHQQVWQVLPLVPVGHGNSPYASPSTFANNPFLISPARLAEAGLLQDEDFAGLPDFPAGHIDFEPALAYKQRLLEKAFERFEQGGSPEQTTDFEAYAARHADWLDDYALFMALKSTYDHQSWTEWPAALVHRDPEALIAARAEYARATRMHKFWQYLFHRQWADLKAHCSARGIRIFGDLPIYVAHDSADVWANQDLFHLDADGQPTVVAGVPPDYFSATGQRWGNPIYRWDVMRERGYDWWTRRLAAVLDYVDIVRLDHFRGFEAYWEIPASEETAVNGQWVEGPGAALFNTIREHLGDLPIVAEDLGLITPRVTALMEELDFPGMAVLHFAFGGGSDSNYLPHNYHQRLVAYTGTHDNDTTLGWWHAGANEHEKNFARDYLDLHDDHEVHWAMIRAALASVADLVIIPLQDVLGLGGEARMNTPGLGEDNWAWRYEHPHLPDDLAERLRHLTDLYGRNPKAAAKG